MNYREKHESLIEVKASAHRFESQYEKAEAKIGLLEDKHHALIQKEATLLAQLNYP